MTDRPDENAVPSEEDSQPESGKTKNPWFMPKNALTDEQLEALNAGDLPELNTNIMLGKNPDPASGWRKPDADLADESVEELITADVIANIKPVSATTADLLAGLDAEAPPESLVAKDSVKDAPEAPITFGQADFADAPVGPIDEPDELGLGGLRDEISAPLTPEVPIRGLGGVSGGSVSQDTRNLSDTSAFGGQQTPAPTSTSAMPANPASGAPMSPQPNPEAEKFRVVEHQVAQLRQQYAQGQITRSQLETQLREHVVMDEQGRWWTIGVDSNRWYRYDGREWIPDTPPQTGSVAAVGGEGIVRGNYTRTETNVPQPTPTPPAQMAPIELDDYGMPLPQQVPQEDIGATMVNLRSATSQHEEQTWAPTQAAQTIASADVIPSPGASAQTMPGAAIEPEATMISGTPQAEAGYEYGHAQAGESANAQPVKKENDLQPDYSAAYSRSLDRSDLVRYTVWGGMGFVVVGLGMTLCVLLGMVGYYFSVVNEYEDRIDTLGQQASTFQTTRIYDVNGTVIAEYNDPNQGARTEVPLEEISPFLIHATIATEDETYYENPGFNVFAILRAIYTNLNSSGPQSGASTITQQLVRALLLEEDFAAQVSSERKITEIILAAEISRKYSKNEILEIYLNEIYYGNLAYGAEAASQVYFGKSVSDLNVYEAAFLAGIPQAPAVWDPVRNRQDVIGRMDTVLRLMAEANGDGCIQMEHANATWDLSVPFCVTETYLNPDLSPDRSLERTFSIDTRIFESPARNLQHAHYVNWIWDELEARYDTNDIYSRGFNVYTTLDPTLQQTAQDSVVSQLASTPYNVNNGSVVVMDPRDGRVMAMVGSADFNNEAIDGQVNVALSPQQPGSSIKPLVYLTAFEGNADGDYYTPATVLWDTPTCWGGYCPPNFDGDFRGPLNIRRALANSLNVPAVKTMNFVTPSRFEQRAQELGLTFPLTTPSESGLPAALGAVEVRLFDLVATYSAFANQGERYQPYGIARIETADGEIIYQHTVTQEGLPINPAHAFLINTILTDTQTRSQEFGFDPRLTVDGYQVAVKTGTSGTTTDTNDMLTIGWTPQVVVGVWMGNTDNSGTGGATGFAVAAPVWDRVMTTALQGQQSISFSPPQQNDVNGFPQNLVQQITVCIDSGTQKPASGTCGVGDEYVEYFFVNQPPPTSDQGFVETIQVDPFTNLRANQFCSDYAVEKTFLNIDDGTAWEWFKTGAGLAWLGQRDIDPNLSQAPEGECQAEQSRPVVLIASPGEGQTLDTLIPITGTATVPNFNYYELQFASVGDPNTFFTIEQHNIEQTGDGTFLGQWDVSSLPNGPYILRLIVVSNTGAQAEFTRNINIFHAVPTVPIQPTAIPGTTPQPTNDPFATPQGLPAQSG